MAVNEGSKATPPPPGVRGNNLSVARFMLNRPRRLCWFCTSTTISLDLGFEMMEHTTEQKASDLFLQAAELFGEERELFLDEACGDQITLRSRVEELLAKDVLAEQGRFLSPHSLNFKASIEGSVDSIVGRCIGSFKVIKRIGEGGMGEVCLAKRNDDYDQEVAIKILRPLLCDDETIRRFESEA